MKKLLLFCAIFAMLWNTIQSQTITNSDVKYRRSSIYTLMCVDPQAPFADTIEAGFVRFNCLDKFDDHNLAVRKIPYDANDKKNLQSNNIKNYLQTNNIAKKMVEKWFNRNEQGAFNMDLIAQRGNYNATDIDVTNAKLTQRGLAMLADAGEELIANTFVLVSFFRYYDKAEDAEKAKTAIGIIGGIASAFVGDVATVAADAANVGATVLGKGYRVRSISYLYKLKWNEEVSSTFYNQFWTDQGGLDVEKVKAFDLSNLFTFDYIGSDQAYEDVQSTIFTNKSDEQLVIRATQRAVDGVIAKLQKNHQEFRTKTPLLTTDPVTAKIGKKEGLEPGDKFDVLEQTIDENGKTVYKKVGVVKVDKTVWDNRYMLAEEKPKDASIDRTLFKKVSGGEFFPGMLLKQSK